MNEDRGVWPSKSGAKGQGRSSTAQRPTSSSQDKNESQASSKGGVGRGQGPSKERGPSWLGPEATQRSSAANSTSLAENHTSMNGHNSRAAEAGMKAPAESRPLVYKPAKKLQSDGRSGSAPRGSKPTCMANGKDFWVDLRKQFTALQRSGGTREGG